MMSEQATESNTSERELPPKELLRLEVGHNAYSGYDPRRLEQNSVMYTIDPNPNVEDTGHNAPTSWTDLRQGYSATGNESYRHVPIWGDGRHLPFADDSLGEVLLSNVVSDPYIPTESIKEMLLEAVRVGEKVIVNNGITPEGARERLASMGLEKVGVSLRTLHENNEDERKEAFGLGLDGIAEEVYVLTKTEEWGKESEVAIAPPKRGGALGRFFRKRG